MPFKSQTSKKAAMSKIAAALSKLPPASREKLAHRLHEYMSRPAGAQELVHTKLAAHFEKDAIWGQLAAGVAKYAPKVMRGVSGFFKRSPMSSNVATHALQGGTVPAVDLAKNVGMQAAGMAPWMILPGLMGGGEQPQQQPPPQQYQQQY